MTEHFARILEEDLRELKKEAARCQKKHNILETILDQKDRIIHGFQSVTSFA
jgi:hypothetical protein